MVKKVLSRVLIYSLLLLMYAPLILLLIFSFVDFDYIDFRQLASGENINFNLYIELFKGEDGEVVISAFRNTLLIALAAGVVSTIIGTLLIGHVVLTVPFVVLSITPKLKQMDPNTYEAALDLGAKPHTALFKIILPQILSGILSGFVLAITLSLDDYIITAFTRNNSFVTLSTYVYGVTSKRGAIPPTLRALSTIIVVATLIVLITVNILSSRKNKKKGAM